MRLRKLAAALYRPTVRVSGTWANSVYFSDSDVPPAKAPRKGSTASTRRQWKGESTSRARRARSWSHRSPSARACATTMASGRPIRPSGGWPTRRRRAAESPRQSSSTSQLRRRTGDRRRATTRQVMCGILQCFGPFIKRIQPDMAIVGPGSVGEATLIPPSGMPGMIRTDDLLSARPPPVFDIYSYHHYAAASIPCASMGPGTQTTAGRQRCRKSG